MLSFRCAQLCTLTIATFILTNAAFARLDDQVLKQADKIVSETISKKGFPGAVLVIGQREKIIYKKAYGHLTYDPKSPAMAMNTLFDLASVSKVVGTATTAMALVEAGRLKLDDKVSSYITGFGVGGKEIVTVKDLMTHVSGLKAYESEKNIEAVREPGMSSADALIKRVASLPATTTPHTVVTYSCLNMLTQARVNETVLKGRQDDFLKKRVYGPLGMKDTTYLPSNEQKKRTAPTVKLSNGTDYVGKVHDPLAKYYTADEHCPGNAGLFSTGQDLAKFCGMMANRGKFNGDVLFKPKTILAMTSVQSPKEIKNLRGLGWDIFPSAPYSTPLNNVDGKRAIGHTGYTGTFLWIDENTGTYMVFLTNRTYPDDNDASSNSVSHARAELVKLILHSLPQYTSVFKNERTVAAKQH